jgi:DNA polymerase-3 subunit epsilon
MKKFFFDLETTGLDNKLNAIHQMSGCIELDGTIIETFNFKIRPFEGAIIEPKALETSNVTEEQIMAYPPAEEVFADFMRMLSRYVKKFDKKDKMFLVGYNNASFDNGFLRSFYERHQRDDYFNSWFWGNSIDVMVLASEYLAEKRTGMENFKLMSVARAVGIEIDETKLHDAEYDIELTRNIYRIVTNKFNKKPEIYGVLMDEMPF